MKLVICININQAFPTHFFILPSNENMAILFIKSQHVVKTQTFRFSYQNQPSPRYLKKSPQKKLPSIIIVQNHKFLFLEGKRK